MRLNQVKFLKNTAKKNVSKRTRGSISLKRKIFVAFCGLKINYLEINKLQILHEVHNFIIPDFIILTEVHPKHYFPKRFWSFIFEGCQSVNCWIWRKGPERNKYVLQWKNEYSTTFIDSVKLVCTCKHWIFCQSIDVGAVQKRMMNYSSLFGIRYEKVEDLFLHFICDSIGMQHIVEPTRMRNKRKPHFLGLVFTSDDVVSDIHHYSSLQRYSPSGDSDHSVLCFKIAIECRSRASNEILGVFRGVNVALEYKMTTWFEVENHSSLEERRAGHHFGSHRAACATEWQGKKRGIFHRYKSCIVWINWKINTGNKFT